MNPNTMPYRKIKCPAVDHNYMYKVTNPYTGEILEGRDLAVLLRPVALYFADVVTGEEAITIEKFYCSERAYIARDRAGAR